MYGQLTPQPQQHNMARSFSFQQSKKKQKQTQNVRFIWPELTNL